jgi:hypothetical protein
MTLMEGPELLSARLWVERGVAWTADDRRSGTRERRTEGENILMDWCWVFEQLNLKSINEKDVDDAVLVRSDVLV